MAYYGYTKSTGTEINLKLGALKSNYYPQDNSGDYPVTFLNMGEANNTHYYVSNNPIYIKSTLAKPSIDTTGSSWELHRIDIFSNTVTYKYKLTVTNNNLITVILNSSDSGVAEKDYTIEPTSSKNDIYIYREYWKNDDPGPSGVTYKPQTFWFFAIDDASIVSQEITFKYPA